MIAKIFCFVLQLKYIVKEFAFESMHTFLES